MNNYLRVDEVVESISKTHSFKKDKLKFLNTSDVYAGKIVSINVLPVSELKGQAKKTIKQHDILFSEIRPKNKRYAYVDVEDTEDFVVSTKLMVLRKFNPDVDNRYLYYFLTNDEMLSALQARAENRICSFPQITFDLLSDYKIRVPALSEQEKIATILSTLDAKINCNNLINAELEALAKTLYDYWFVQFDFPDANDKPYQSSGGKMAYNPTLKREIPEGWEARKIDQVALIKAGGDKPKNFSLFCSNEYPIPIFSNGISNEGLYGYTNMATIQQPSITVSARGTIGYSVLRLKPFVPIIRLIVLTPLEKSALKYIEETIKRLGFDNSGSVQQQLTAPQISGINILYPSSNVLDSYSKIVTPIVNQLESLKEQSKELSHLRDWLLPMLINGQVTVK
jgi:type I restriction enzyme S subunit